ncbi:lysylphosphatidylglycerol synthase transmembrane domain-containing protein [Teredinibacter waterburyi]|jgi:Uncharacterised protein family (UPF0104).|uniref:lysylphosphatidylglycerol synthase transmembrane domain-containing protein n=1 Tax=Teredinibacter waterburyi TaxID=1500538 RepID=UPI00165FCB22|nr:lysylphosphatidylglycerol synthase domain-containing protein [Teredinibacter waterburyi]
MPPKLTLILKATFALLMLAALIWWVQSNYGWLELLSAWNQVPLATIGLAALLVIGSHFLRVLRVYRAYSYHTCVDFRLTSSVSLVHNTVSFLLPMRLGEIALPALSKHQLGIELRYSSATLVLLRLFDAHMLALLLLFFTGSLWLSTYGLGQYAIIIPLSLITALPFCIHLLKWGCSRSEKLRFLLPLIQTPQSWLTLYALTMALWLIKLLALALVAAALGHIAIDHAWIATIIADGSALSPLTGFANAGTFELAFAAPLLPLGYELNHLVKVAVNLHLFIFVINIAVGIFGFIGLNPRTQP